MNEKKIKKGILESYIQSDAVSLETYNDLYSLLTMLPDAVVDAVIENVVFIGLEERSSGMFYSAENMRNIIFIDENLLKFTPEKIKYYIFAHEIAHFINDKNGDANSEEKTNELVKEWGFYVCDGIFGLVMNHVTLSFLIQRYFQFKEFDENDYDLKNILKEIKKLTKNFDVKRSDEMEKEEIQIEANSLIEFVKESNYTEEECDVVFRKTKQKYFGVNEFFTLSSKEGEINSIYYDGRIHLHELLKRVNDGVNTVLIDFSDRYNKIHKEKSKEVMDKNQLEKIKKYHNRMSKKITDLLKKDKPVTKGEFHKIFINENEKDK